MKNKLTFLFIVITSITFAQVTNNVKLRNAIVIGQLDKSEDRFTAEINLTEMLAERGIKAKSSLNILKQGQSKDQLASDSITNKLKEQGFDTYLLVSVRGYDKMFKPAKNHLPLNEELNIGHLFPLYRDDISSISFEFTFYRNGQIVGYDLVKIAGVSSREVVMKKFRKKIGKRINTWRN